MHMSHIPQCTIQNRNVHIPILIGVLWDMGQMHCGICEFGLLPAIIARLVNLFTYIYVR